MKISTSFDINGSGFDEKQLIVAFDMVAVDWTTLMLVVAKTVAINNFVRQQTATIPLMSDSARLIENYSSVAECENKSSPAGISIDGQVDARCPQGTASVPALPFRRYGVIRAKGSDGAN
uniref:Uncharacterized protein n=1 Tax=Plectus sambesii TaxID=2011161 RepID=A0A914X3I9_9BILA